MMHKVLRSTALGLLVFAGLTACGDKTTEVNNGQPPVTVTSVLVTPSSVNLNVGESVKLVATVVGDTASIRKGVTWTSSDQTKATVDASGNVSAKAPGTVVITATSVASSSIIGTSTIVIAQAQPNRIRSVAVTPSAANIQVGENVTFQANVTADAGVVSSVTWTSSDTTKVRISSTGQATGKAPGTVVITARARPTSGTSDTTSVAGTATVVVASPNKGITSISLTPSSLNLVVGQTTNLVATVNATDSTVSRTVKYASTNSGVAAVNATTGQVTAVAAGSAVITATSTFDTTKQAAAAVTVSSQAAQTVRAITVQPSNVSLQIGATQQFVAIVSADTGVTQAQRSVNWTSSDTTRLTINQTTGVATAKAAGTVVVSATSTYNSNVVGTAVAVIPSPVARGVTNITLTPSSASLKIGEKVQLVANVTADSGISRAVTYTSTNNTVASVDPTGLVTAGASGTAVITATAVGDTTKQATSTIVVQPVTQATATVQSLNNAAGTPIDINNVSGTFYATVNLDAGTQHVDSLRLMQTCNGVSSIVGRQTFAAAAAKTVDAAGVPVVFTVNTAAFNTANGQPSFINGSCTLSAQVFANGSSTPATGTPQAFTLNNTDVFFVATLNTTATKGVGTNTDETGVVWNEGKVNVTVFPVFFSGNTLASATVQLFSTAPNTISAAGANIGGTPAAPVALTAGALTVPANGGVVTFGRTGATGTGSNTLVEGVTAGGKGSTGTANTGVVAMITGATYANGQTITVCNQGSFSGATLAVGATPAACGTANVLFGPSATAPATTTTYVRLDDRAPVAGTFVFTNQNVQGNYLGASFSFTGASGANTTSYTKAANPVGTVNNDWGGVDRTTTFTTFGFAANTGANTVANTCTGNGAGTTAIAAGAITNTAGLVSTATNTAYVFCMYETDALGNVTASLLPAPVGGVNTFGVDIAPPVLTFTSKPSDLLIGTAASGTNINVAASADTGTGSGTSRVWAAVVRQAANVAYAPGGVNAVTYPVDATTYTGGAGVTSLCVVGKFSAATLSTGGLAVYDSVGTLKGYCNPIDVTALAAFGGGGNYTAVNIPNDAGTGLNGYFTHSVAVADVAGNMSGFTALRYLIDNTAPQQGAVSVPTALPVSGSFTVTSSGKDNLDLKAANAYLNYAGLAAPAGAMQFYQAQQALPGVAFDNVLTISASESFTFGTYYSSIQEATPAPQPAVPNADRPTTAAVQTFDMAINGTGTVASPAIAPTAFGAADANFSSQASFTSWTAGVSSATVSNCPIAGCAGGAAPTKPTVVLSAQAQGTSGVFVSPFGRVDFYYKAPNGTWYLAGSTSSANVQDTGVGGARTYTYSFTWTPPKTTPDYLTGPGGTTGNLLGGSGAAVTIRALGVSTGGGSALTTTNDPAVTFINP